MGTNLLTREPNDVSSHKYLNPKKDEDIENFAEIKNNRDEATDFQRNSHPRGIDRPRGSTVYRRSNLPLAETLSGLLGDNDQVPWRKVKGCSGRAPTFRPSAATLSQDLRGRCGRNATGTCWTCVTQHRPATMLFLLSMNSTNNDKPPGRVCLWSSKNIPEDRWFWPVSFSVSLRACDVR